MSCLFQSLRQLWMEMQENAGLARDVLMVGLVDSLAIVLLTAIAYSYYWWWSKHPLYGQNKGPKIYPIIGSMGEILRNRGRMPDYVLDMLSSVPGHTARAVRPGSLNTYYTANPANVEYMLKTNFENYRKAFKEELRELLGDGIFNADDQLWKIQRKVASYEFTTRSLRDYVLDSAVKEASGRLLPFLSHASQSGRSFDLQDIFARFAFDNICQLAFGVDPACLDISLPRVKFAEAFDKATLLCVTYIQSFPRIWWKIRRALNIGKPRELKLALSLINEFSMGVIGNRRQELALAEAKGDKEALGGRTDLLSRFMTLLDNEEQGDGQVNVNSDSEGIMKWMADRKSSNGKKYTDVFLRDIIISFVLAGRDTSTSALSWFFWLLASHPHVEQVILEEISKVTSTRPPSPAEDGENNSVFSFEELKSMHYLHAALTECIRLYPPVPSDFKTARKADVFPDGTVIFANALVAYHPYAMGRLEDLWGKDCLEFKPDRWLKDGIFVPQSPYKYTVFQAGPRTCLGKDMVMLQMKLICAAILRNFKLSVPQDYKAQYLSTLTMKIKDGLPVTVQKRNTPGKV